MGRACLGRLTSRLWRLSRADKFLFFRRSGMTDAKKPNFSIRFQNGPAMGNAQGPRVQFPSAGVSFGVPMPQAAARQPLPALPDDAEACNAQGNGWLQANRVADAIQAYDRAIALQGNYVDPYFNRGNALLRLGRTAEALASFEKAIALAPSLAVAHYNRATVLEGLGRIADAMDGYRTVLQLEPNNAQAQFNLGCLYERLKAYEEALACMDQTIAIAPQLAQAHNNRGNALLKLNRRAEALDSFNQALALQPDFSEALSNRGNVYFQLKKYEDSCRDVEKSISLNPRRAEAHFLLGGLHKEMRNYKEALGCFQNAYQLNAKLPSLLSNIAQVKTTICSWKGLLDGILPKLEGLIDEGNGGVIPFPILGLVDSPDLQLRAAANFVNNDHPSNMSLGPVKMVGGHRKIRVGYYSADFHHHATTILMAELFELHDHERFEWFAFSFGPDIQDEMRARISRQFDHFHDVRERSDKEIAVLSRELGIDIAVDLKGFTQDSRLGIFSYRCAPVQVSYIGYPGSTGAPYMDYVIADKVVVPPSGQRFFSEKVVYLPNSYQVNDSKRRISGRQFSREELGLPAEGFVFCCFNNNYKILPPMFDGWMRILQAVDGSVLWLLEDNPGAASNLRQEAAARGVAAERLVFAPRMPLDEHLARHRQADLFLDTLPCNAHTTASDALWAGLPVLTCAGSAFASRVAASLLHAVGLPELVVDTQQAYEARAIALARDAQAMQALRDRLKSLLPQAPLFDTRRFARDIEAAYVAMHGRAVRGLPPDVIEV